MIYSILIDGLNIKIQWHSNTMAFINKVTIISNKKELIKKHLVDMVRQPLVSPSHVSCTAGSLSSSQTIDFKANDEGGGLPLTPNKVTRNAL